MNDKPAYAHKGNTGPAQLPGMATLFPDRPPRVEQLVRPFMVKKAVENTRRYDIFHPSAWGSCLRKIAYQYYNEKEKFWKKNDHDVDLRLERVFDNGHGMHARWQDWLDKAGYLRGAWKCTNPLCGMIHGHGETHGILNPQRTQPGWRCECGNGKSLLYQELDVVSPLEYNFEGHCDALVDVRDTPAAKGSLLDLFIVDMKTMNSEMFSDLTEAKYEHVVQVHIYMWVLDVHAAVVLYENKDNQAIKEMFVPRDDSLIEKIKEQALWMVEVLKQRKLPKRPPEFSRSKFPCRMCEFSTRCY